MKNCYEGILGNRKNEEHVTQEEYKKEQNYTLLKKKNKMKRVADG
jgi:hypothetical protein